MMCTYLNDKENFKLNLNYFCGTYFEEASCIIKISNNLKSLSLKVLKPQMDEESVIKDFMFMSYYIFNIL